MQLPAAGREYAHLAFSGPVIPTAWTIAGASQTAPLSWWDATTDPVYIDVAAKLGVNIADVLAGTARIGRVVVAASARGKGIATRMMRFAMDHATTRGETRFYLTAQIDKLALYEKLGFVAFGDEFQDGGMPHLAMKNY